MEHAVSVDKARLDMFARKQRPYEAIPPTSAAPQHTKRAAYQAGCIWAQATQRQSKAESPADWGWKTVGGSSGQQIHQLHKVVNICQVWLQIRVLWKVQMFQIGFHLHSAVQLQM